MASTREVVQEIREFLGGRPGMDLATLTQLARDYAEAAKGVIDRAERCRELLQRDQRAAALELANSQPTLAEEFALVASCAEPRWLDLCRRRGLPLPPPLDGDAVRSVIDDLAARSGALEGLLRLHRRMALGHAPLADRVRVLRRLCREDRRNAFWQEDLRAFERARLEELVREAQLAVRHGELDAFESAFAELKESPWGEPPPARLFKHLEQIALPLRRSSAAARYLQIAERMLEAHAAMDEDACMLLAADAASIAAVSGVAPEGEAAAQIAATSGWLEGLRLAREEDKAYETACAVLEKAVEETLSAENLEKLANAVLAYKRGMPENLAARLASRAQISRRRSMRRLSLAAVAALGALLLAGVWAWTAVSRRAGANPAQRAEIPLSAQTDSGGLDAASAALRNIKLHYADAAALAATLASFAGANPDHALAADFTAASGHAAQWAAWEKFDRLLAAWDGDARVADGATARRRLDDLDRAAAAAGMLPDLLASYRSYLETAAAALPDGQTLTGLVRLEPLLRNPLLADLLAVRAADGRVYYLLDDKIAETAPGAWSFRYLVNGRMNLADATLEFRDLDGGRFALLPAPQNAFSREALAMVRDLQAARGRGWETFYLRMAAALQRHSDVDPLLGANIMRMILDNAAVCTPLEASHVSAIAARVAQSDHDVAWMDPDDEEAVALRPQVALALRHVEPLGDLAARLDARLGEFHWPSVAGIIPRRGEVELVRSVPAARLFAIRAGALGAPVFTDIGAVENGVITLGPAAGEFPSGTPVYADR